MCMCTVRAICTTSTPTSSCDSGPPIFIRITPVFGGVASSDAAECIGRGYSATVSSGGAHF